MIHFVSYVTGGGALYNTVLEEYVHIIQYNDERRKLLVD